MKLRTKLNGAFAIVCLIGAAVSGIGIANMRQMNESADRVYRMDLIGLSLVKEANVDLLYVGRSLRNALLAETAERRDAALKKADEDLALMRSNLDKAKPLFWSEKGKAAYAALDGDWAAYVSGVQAMRAKTAAAPLDARSEVVKDLFETFAPVVNRIDTDIDALVDVKENNARLSAQASQQRYETTSALMIAMVTGAVMLGLGIGLWLSRSIARQLGGEPDAAAALAQRVARGDLSAPIDLRRDDASSVMAALKTMQTQLAELVLSVRRNSESVATASSQIAQGNLELSQRTEEQAAALEQTASAMSELTSTVEHNAGNARQANDLAATASRVASDGGGVVAQVVDTIRGIDESSKKIADIIGVIDGIAFQTNILALNAAVEAARAGESGRGFAVVASEVRSLAQRSSNAAKEIKALISASVSQVEQGTVLADKAGSTMAEVVASIGRVAQMVGEISHASAEQSSGVSQIGQAVSQMDQTTQQNAALVEESAAAAASLKLQARQLVETVGVFTLPAA